MAYFYDSHCNKIKSCHKEVAFLLFLNRETSGLTKVFGRNYTPLSHAPTCTRAHTHTHTHIPHPQTYIK